MIALGATRPSSTGDMSPSERRFVTVLQQLGFGHLESIKVRCGALILDPWPTVVQVLKFGAAQNEPPRLPAEFELKTPMADFFKYIRGVEDGEVRRLEVRHGLPFPWRLSIASRERCRMSKGSMLKLFEVNGRRRLVLRLRGGEVYGLDVVDSNTHGGIRMMSLP